MTTFSSVIPLTEIEQLGGFFENWQGECNQFSSGRFEGRLRVVKGNVVRVANVEYNQRVAFRGLSCTGLIAVYPVLDSRSTNSWQGCLLRPGQIVVGRTDHELSHCSPPQTSDWGVHFAADMLTDAARALHTTDGPELPSTWDVYSSPPDAIAGLMLQLGRKLDLGLADPEFPGSPEGHRLEQECVRALVAALMRTEEPPVQFTIRGRSQLVGRGEEFLRARLGDHVGMVDLCAALGANDRTLRLAFRERFGVGPMTYLRILRLNAVRSQLRKDPHMTVTDAARMCGFHHLGNFAGDYRRLFGELPSETARRS